MKKKPIVIAGNGPSLANIDYKRLPKDFDCFRVNQFAFEEKYYLGHNVTGFLCPSYFIENLNYYHHFLEQKGEYFFNRNFYTHRDSYNFKNKFYYSNFESAISIIEENPVFKNHLRFYKLYFNKYSNAGTLALLLAIQLGYTEIYVVGIDLYQGGMNYAFSNNKQIYSEVRKEFYENDSNYSFKSPENELRLNHSEEMEKATINLAKSVKGVKIYSICDTSPINELLPLAPELKDYFAGAEPKTENALLDWVKTPMQIKELEEKGIKKKELGQKRSFKDSVKHMFIKKGMLSDWDHLRQNVWVRLCYHTIKPIWIACKFIVKRSQR